MGCHDLEYGCNKAGVPAPVQQRVDTGVPNNDCRSVLHITELWYPCFAVAMSCRLAAVRSAAKVVPAYSSSFMENPTHP